MNNKNKTNRIRPNDVHHRTCYFCLNKIEYEQSLSIHRGLPHHLECVELSKNNIMLTRFIDGLLDYFRLFEDDGSYIKYIIEDLDSALKNYVIDAQPEFLTVYLLTEQMVKKISMSYDMRRDRYEEVVFPIRDMIFINRLF